VYILCCGHARVLSSIVVHSNVLKKVDKLITYWEFPREKQKLLEPTPDVEYCPWHMTCLGYQLHFIILCGIFFVNPQGMLSSSCYAQSRV
jgi:hypothetical protein